MSATGDDGWSLEAVREALAREDSFALILRQDACGDRGAAAERYDRLVRELYWQAKDLPAVVFLARAGIQFCLVRAAEAAETDPDLADRLRGAAKTLAYNLGSFTWLGWDEPGVEISRTDLAAGYDAARLNLRLAVELERGPGRLSAAHWLMGAHHLAAGEHDSAAAAFERGAGSCPEDEGRRMGLGYAALARLAARPADDATLQEFEETMAALRALETEDSKFFAEQIEAARRLFLPGSGAGLQSRPSAAGAAE
jgi:hypothetical protein